MKTLKVILQNVDGKKTQSLIKYPRELMDEAVCIS